MHIQKLYKFYDRMQWFLDLQHVCNNINMICFSDFVHEPGLSSINLNQSSKYFKNWFFGHENRGSSADENGALNSFNLRGDPVMLLTFVRSKIFSKIKHNSAVPAASAGP